MKKIISLAIVLCGLTTLPGQEQPPVQSPTPVSQLFSEQELDKLLGPIALYPDPLLAQILPASSVPTQIVLADRYIAGGGDPNQADKQPWEPSVQALARYPSLLKWMDDNLTWTTQLGQAFSNQQQDVMNSIQRLRASAQSRGNLPSTPQQQVVVNDGDIEILPADPQVIYVPVYSPDEVYWQSSFGEPFITFGIGWPIGFWLDRDFDWHHHHLVVWPHDHFRPVNWWRERPDRREATMEHNTSVWHPGNRQGTFGAHRGDRGWNNPGAHPMIPPANRPEVRPPPQPHGVPPANRPETRPPPQPHNVFPPANKPEVRPPPQSPSVPPPNRPETRPPESRDVPTGNPSRPASSPSVNRTSPAPPQNPPAVHPRSNDALVGIQSSHETRTFSDRGQQSRETVSRSESASHSSSSSSRGGGDRDQDSSKQRR